MILGAAVTNVAQQDTTVFWRGTFQDAKGVSCLQVAS